MNQNQRRPTGARPAPARCGTQVVLLTRTRPDHTAQDPTSIPLRRKATDDPADRCSHHLPVVPGRRLPRRAPHPTANQHLDHRTGPATGQHPMTTTRPTATTMNPHPRPNGVSIVVALLTAITLLAGVLALAETRDPVQPATPPAAVSR